jgi:putative ABC transport system permease protein
LSYKQVLYSKLKINKDYNVLKEEVQKMSELIPGTLLEDRVEWFKEAQKSDVTYDLLQYSISIILILISGLSIYNNINYNLISRIREHGIMKAIGLTKKCAGSIPATSP